jgi:putative colanic acid biosynthesis acetyltransferase WcaF
MRLDQFSSAKFDRGAPRKVEILWVAANALLLSSWLPGSQWRVKLLRAFGAHVGQRVVVKPGVRVKFPWRLQIGHNSWIGEDVWIDNLANVQIGSNVCISQGVYFCTGSHDWSSKRFDLITKAIIVHDMAWIAARATLGPGAIVGEGAVLALGSSTSKSLGPWTINFGAPAQEIAKRKIQRVKNLP